MDPRNNNNDNNDNNNMLTTTTSDFSSATTNRRNPPPKKQKSISKTPYHITSSPNNGNKSRKRRKPRFCFGCGRIGLVASMAMFLLFSYGIAMTQYIFVFDDKYDVNHQHHSHNDHSKTAGWTKEEERDYLEMKQQETLGEIRQRKKTRNQDYEENLEKFLKTKKVAIFQPKYSKMIHFLHIHKSAGTFICKQAFQNKLAIDLKRNCNVRDDQKCCWYDQEKKSWTEKVDDITDGNQLMQQSIDFAKNAPFDFVATEKELAGPMLTDHYDYVVSLRDSKSRYKSHWQHLIRNAKQRKKEVERFQKRRGKASRKAKPEHKASRAHRGGGYLVSGQKNSPQTSGDMNDNTNSLPWGLDKTSNVLVGPRSKWAKTGEDPEIDPTHWNLTVVNPKDGSIHPVGNFTKWMDGQPDNYSLRMICGPKCLDVPKYGITKELFDYTLEKLWTNFSHILFVEDMEESFARFAKSYGWNKLDSTRNEKKNDGKKKSKDSSSLSMAYDEPFLTALDDALYELAKRKYNSANGDSLPDVRPFENQKMVDAYFREGPSRNCTNPCCGYCSKW